MTRLECATSLIWNIRHLEFCTNEDISATARTIMDLGKLESQESFISYEVKTPKEMSSTGAPPREWM